jgi:hypothetical protein
MQRDVRCAAFARMATVSNWRHWHAQPLGGKRSEGFGIRYAGALPAISFRRLPRAFARGRLSYARVGQPQCFCKTLELPTSQLRACQTPRSLVRSASTLSQNRARATSERGFGRAWCELRAHQTPLETWNQTPRLRTTYSLDLCGLMARGWVT